MPYLYSDMILYIMTQVAIEIRLSLIYVLPFLLSRENEQAFISNARNNCSATFF